jgi:ATP-dependent RNA helicase DHX57
MARKTPKLAKPPKPPEPEDPAPVSAKPKRGKQANSVAGLDEAPGAASTPAKPRALVAPSSWTGKLPVTLLHEHCQKAGWNKVDYGIVEFPSQATLMLEK